jgi:nucleotide-binding universal stress UspA family protein
MNTKPVILVPTDFTPIGESATLYAEALAKELQAEVQLLHIVSSDKELPNAKLAIDNATAAIQSKHIATKGIIEKGSIYEDIGRVAKETEAKLIIMGTHGDKGLQKVFGSKALKVITNSDVPFLIVQRKPMNPQGFKNIIVPLSLEQEVKQTLYYTADLAKVYGSKIHILYVNEKDEFFRAKIERNIPAAKDILDEKGFDYEFVGIEKKNMSKELLQYAQNVNADLIAFINNHENFATYLGGSFEQSLIANDAEIPVLVINSIMLKTDSMMNHMFR